MEYLRGSIYIGATVAIPISTVNFILQNHYDHIAYPSCMFVCVCVCVYTHTHKLHTHTNTHTMSPRLLGNARSLAFIGTQKKLVALHSALFGSRQDGPTVRTV